MSFKEFHYRWEWLCRSSAEALWPLVADTDRFNRDANIPPIKRQPQNTDSAADGGQRLQIFFLGMAIEWDEEPFEWVRPQRFGVMRRYLSGPVAGLQMSAEFNPEPDGGCRLIYQIRARPRNWIGQLLIPVQIGWLTARKFETIIRRYDQLAANRKSLRPGTPADFLHEPVRLAPGGRERIAVLSKTLVAKGVSSQLVDRLTEFIEKADDITLSCLRPYALAENWEVSRRDILELCLHATREGLLEFRWELLCPLCRGAKQTSTSLGGIRSKVHCDSCNIDFTANFERSVELKFRPNPIIRKIDVREFCIGGPQVTPHIVAQQLLEAGANRSITLSFEEGRYRMRTMQKPGGQFLSISSDGQPQATLRLETSGWPADEARVISTALLQLENATNQKQLFILERMAWNDQAVTAAEVTALQAFRDLFANEALRPNEQISVGSLTILFTDLRDSTRLYREIGDAPAFGCVMNHFDILRTALAAEEGALVKTIGDAVMAVFRHPAAALRTVLRAQQILASPPPGTRPLRLKAGIHYGPCIAVNLNDRLDYFGSTVNIAARLEGLSSGNDIIISSNVRSDPEVADLLAKTNGIFIEPLEAVLKGFDQERFELWRVMSTEK